MHARTMQRALQALEVLMAAAALAACGGGGGDPGTCSGSPQLCNPLPSAPRPAPTPAPAPPAPAPSPAPAPAPSPSPASPQAGIDTPEGLWTGTASNGRRGYALVLDNGALWFIYTVAGNESLIAGVGQGWITATGMTFAGNDLIDVNLEGLGVNSASVSGSYTPRGTITGAIQYQNSRVIFSGDFDAAYLLTPSVAQIAGTYAAPVLVGNSASGAIEQATTVVTADGQITGVSRPSGCRYGGTIAPRITGNVFATKITFGGPPCLLGASTVDGVAVFNANTQQMLGAAVNNARTAGFFMLGSRQ